MLEVYACQSKPILVPFPFHSVRGGRGLPVTKRRVEYIRDKISGEGGRKASRTAPSASAAATTSDGGKAVYDDDDDNDDTPAVSARTAGSGSVKKVSRGAIHGSRSRVGGVPGQGNVSTAAAAAGGGGEVAGKPLEEDGGEEAGVDFMAELRDRFAVVGAEELASDEDLALLADDALFSQPPLPADRKRGGGGDGNDDDEAAAAAAASSSTAPGTATATAATGGGRGGGGGGNGGLLPTEEVIPAAAAAAAVIEAHHDEHGGDADAANMEGEQRGDLDLDLDNGRDANIGGGDGEKTGAAASDDIAAGEEEKEEEEVLLGKEAENDSGEEGISPLAADEKQKEGGSEQGQEEPELRVMKVRSRFFSPSYDVSSRTIYCM